MLLLVRYLIEFDKAAVDRAQEGALPRVDPQMIKQIVPLPEHLSALPVVLFAEEYALLPAAL